MNLTNISYDSSPFVAMIANTGRIRLCNIIIY